MKKKYITAFIKKIINKALLNDINEWNGVKHKTFFLPIFH